MGCTVDPIKRNLIWTKSRSCAPNWFPMLRIMFANMLIWTMARLVASCMTRVAKSIILGRNNVLREWWIGIRQSKFRFARSI